MARADSPGDHVTVRKAGVVKRAALLVLVLGCPAAVSAAAPTFTKDVAPILYASCIACHRPGEIAPMSLVSYDEARPWARSIKTKVESRQMPPWFADPAHGQFANDRSLPQ